MILVSASYRLMSDSHLATLLCPSMVSVTPIYISNGRRMKLIEYESIYYLRIFKLKLPVFKFSQ